MVFDSTLIPVTSICFETQCWSSGVVIIFIELRRYAIYSVTLFTVLDSTRLQVVCVSSTVLSTLVLLVID